MPFFGLAVASFAASVGAFLYAGSHGGFDAEMVVRDRVLTGPMLYGIAALLFLAGAFFVVAAAIRTVRRLVAFAAIAFLLAGGGIGLLSPQDLTDYAKEHGCPKEGLSAAVCAQVGDHPVNK